MRSEPVVWRGSLISGTVMQFWTDVIWTGVDYMFIDMPQSDEHEEQSCEHLSAIKTPYSAISALKLPRFNAVFIF